MEQERTSADIRPWLRDRKHIVVQSLLGSLDPVFEPVALPSARLHLYKYDPRGLHKQDAQVTVVALRYLAEDRAIAGRDLLRDQSQPGSKIATLGEAMPVPIAATMALEVMGDRTGAGSVASLARPGGNAIGFMTAEYSIGGKYLELLKQIAPGLTLWSRL